MMKYGTKIKQLPPMYFAWLKERNEVCKSYDVEAFKKFFVNMRKMVYNMNSSTAEEKAEAKRWLEEHGSTTEMG